MDKYLITADEINTMTGLAKTHFLNKDAQRSNKSLGDLTGLTGLGFHLIEVPPGKWSTEFHVHYYEDECTYVLSGTGSVTIGDDTYTISAGDFIGYRKGGLPHTMQNTGNEMLKCIVVGERLAHDTGDYPNKGKRIHRNAGLPWELVDLTDIEHPSGGAK